MSSASPVFEDALAQARLAVAAHRDALAAVKDAKFLRLDYLRDSLLKVLPEDSGLRKTMVLRLPPEDEARLLLDYKHSVVMAPDGRSYRLEADHAEGRLVLLESARAEDIAADIVRREAVARVEEAASAPANREGRSGASIVGDSWAQAIFLFLTGMVFGATALWALAMYLKTFTF